MKKYTLILFIFAFVLLNFKFANADDSGCTGTAFSSTTGAPCNMSPNTLPSTTSTYPIGCTSGVGFSSTTGASCDTTQQSANTTSTTVTQVTTPTLPAGCTSSAGWSSTTGAPCDITQQYVNTTPAVTPVTVYNPVVSAPISTYTPPITVSSTPAGCTSDFGFNSTTGASCDTSNSSTQTYSNAPQFTGPTLPLGCTSSSGSSSTTGAPCDTTPGYQSGCLLNTGWSTTTGLACSGTVNASSANTVISNSTQVKTESPSTNFTALTSSACTISSVLKIGATGDGVSCLQSHIGLTPDGKFGPRTQMAVEAFQNKAGLKADGVVGPKSIAALESTN